MTETAALEAVEAWIADVLAQMEPAQRAKLMRALSQEMRRANVGRVAAQTNPDGSAFAPRKRQPLKTKAGRIRRRGQAMFQKLRQARYFTARATPDEASVGFDNPQVSRIAWVHQRGLRDRVRRLPGAAEVDYPVRELVGLGAQDPERFMDLVLTHIGGD
ncbi:phage virion morphogenesis protein [Brevundimonas nasdae]|uniref:phage virion morphogenesis protein n=1 Tax=Brevundimonas nasdae TaxID=172043 RepID=UPI003F694454